MQICGDDRDEMMGGWLTDLKKGTVRAVKGVSHVGLNMTRSYIKGVTGQGGAIPADALQPAPVSSSMSQYLPYALGGGVLLLVLAMKMKPSGARR